MALLGVSVAWTVDVSTNSGGVTPAVADVDGDGRSEIFVVGNDSLYCFDSRGNIIWQVKTPHLNPWWDFVEGGPTVADVDYDGTPELFLHSKDTLFCLNARDGSLRWKRALPGTPSRVMAEPTVANVDHQGNAEIVVGTGDSIACFGADGTLIWKAEGGFWGTAPIVVDFDEDDTPEVLVGKRCLNGVTGSLKWTSQYCLSCGGVADLDGDGYAEIVSFNSDTVICIERDGSVKWKWVLSSSSGTHSVPAIGDVDGNGKPEIVFFTYNANMVWAIEENASGTGAILKWSAYSADSTGSSSAGPVMCDVNGDGRYDVIMRGGKDLKVFDGPTGNLIYSDTSFGSCTAHEHGAVAADVDGDGYVEIVVVGVDKLGLIDDFPAPLHKRHFQTFTYHISNIDEDLSVPVTEELYWKLGAHNTYLVQADYYPYGTNESPSRASALVPVPGKGVRLVVSEPSEALLRVYSVDGRLVLSKDLGRLEPGEHLITLNLKPGIYLVRLSLGRASLKALLVK